MSIETRPNLLETALGGLLQDIGKFMQRAHGAVRNMDSKVREREPVILPVYQSRYSHKHVLWTEAFFQWMEDEGLAFPSGISRDRVRDMAVFHHKPEAFGALGWLQAEADRLSSGMDRKRHDEDQENKAEHKGWDAFIKTAMLSPFSPVDLGQGPGPQHWQPLAELKPGDDLMPAKTIDTADYQNRYKELWDCFTAEFRELCRLDHPALFCEGLLSLSERFTWAIPSSTVDLPDISLHDHNRTVAAIAACLYAWHDHHGSLDDATAVKDRDQPKFRLLAGDLSGIQHTLFTLAHQQVKGVNRILRARSFLMGMLTDAAALRCREALVLPVFTVLQQAGGRFVLLAADIPDIDQRVAALREEIDAWMNRQYLGELNLNLALSEPFAGRDFFPPHYRRVQDNLNRRLEIIKLQPLSGQATGIHDLDYEHDICTACDKRPAREVDPHDERVRRCAVCATEHRIGQRLPHARAARWRRTGTPADERTAVFFGDLQLQLLTGDQDRLPAVRSEMLSGFRLYRGDYTVPGAWALRFVANYVPVLSEEDQYDTAALSEETQEIAVGEAKTFEHLALDAMEKNTDGDRIGKPFLGVLKADVDNLGLIFSEGLRHPETNQDRNTISRSAALSRMLDLFFTGYLQELLRRQYYKTYTVYAGGDDLLLIGPWRNMIDLARSLDRDFRRYTAENPNITLSAGLELTRANHPLNRSAQAAETRLERVKETREKDGFCLLDEQPVRWGELDKLLSDAELLNRWLRDKLVGTALVYKLLYFAEQRRLAECGGEVRMDCVDWRARWAYYLARNVRDNRALVNAGKVEEVMKVLNRLLGLDQDIHKQTLIVSPRIPVNIALYRNRQ